MVLAKEKNEAEAMDWFLKSVHAFPMNWGCWQEMAATMSRVEDVSSMPSPRGMPVSNQLPAQ